MNKFYPEFRSCCAKLESGIKTRVMRERWILFLVLGWWAGRARCEQGFARDWEVRRALPADTDPSAASVPAIAPRLREMIPDRSPRLRLHGLRPPKQRFPFIRPVRR